MTFHLLGWYVFIGSFAGILALIGVIGYAERLSQKQSEKSDTLRKYLNNRIDGNEQRFDLRLKHLEQHLNNAVTWNERVNRRYPQESETIVIPMQNVSEIRTTIKRKEGSETPLATPQKRCSTRVQ